MASDSAMKPADERSIPRRLGDLPSGETAVISHANDASTLRRLILLGLIDGAVVCIESRGRCADLVVEAEGARFHLTARDADNIWVKPLGP